MAFLTDPQVKQKVADALGVATGDVPSKYASLITQANADAQNEIRSRLKARGYTAAQIGQWARAAEFNGDIACFWVFTRGGALDAEVLERLNKLDRRSELDTVWLLDSDGEDILPGGSVGGGISMGLVNTSRDLFVLDPDDERRGQPTRW